ncbi:MAG: hypothetical protein R3F37_17005 [Candidatus Competibacteraceae bacterium]
MPKLARTILAFDFGLARIGVAVGQESSSLPAPAVGDVKEQATTLMRDAIGRFMTECKPDLCWCSVPRHARTAATSTRRCALAAVARPVQSTPLKPWMNASSSWRPVIQPL